MSKINSEFHWPIRVYIEDTDTGGIVYYINHLKFMERARTELLRHLGYQQQMLKTDGHLFVVKNVEIRYQKPARLDDELLVKTRIKAQSPASLLFEQQLWRERDQITLCQADIKVVCVHSQTLQPIALPASLAEVISAYRSKPTR
jgi:tol-pal system-associated acyl-CoA thioesterase